MSGKQSGLGSHLYIGGYDLSGDINSLSKISGSQATIDVTSIDQFANSRLGGQRTGEIDFTSLFNPATGREHPVLAALPRTDVDMMYSIGSAIGSPAACMRSKQPNYDGTRGTDGSFTFQVAAVSNAFGLEWGELLTAGESTVSGSVDSGSGTLTSVDFGVGTLDFGGQAYLQVTAFTGTDISIGVNTSSDNSSFAGIASLEQQVTSAPSSIRSATAATTAVKRYNQVYWYTTGGFTSATFVLTFVRNPVAVTF